MDTSDTLVLKEEIEQIQFILQQWFPYPSFVKAASIKNHPILPEESAVIANAVSHRQQEFATGRWLARTGLQEFGFPDQPINVGKLRNPVWPDSIMGTITHDEKLCAVVLMQKHQHSETGIGIDLIYVHQRAGRMDELLPMFMADASELNAISIINDNIDPALLLFSVKESIVKAISFRLDDFVDMRAIKIYYSDKVRFRVSGNSINAEILASTTKDYLLTAVKVY